MSALPRLKREEQTLQIMVQIYCDRHHVAEFSQNICPICREFLDYALYRVQQCRYRELKPACSECPTHCYKPAPREAAREIMKFSGPKMLFRHPILAILHLWDQLTSKGKLKKWRARAKPL